MKSKILFICCFILLLCGCSKKEDTKTEELLTNNDIGFTIIVEDGRGITKDSKINHINDYIGDQYIESKKNNDTVYYNDSIQITLNKKNKVKNILIIPIFLMNGRHIIMDISEGENSWKSILESEGLRVECLMNSLLQYNEIRKLYIEMLDFSDNLQRG